MYDPQLLKGLDFDSLSGVFSPPVTATEPGETWLLVRPLEIEDYDRGYVQLLSQLTAVGNVTRNDFERKNSLSVFEMALLIRYFFVCHTVYLLFFSYIWLSLRSVTLKLGWSLRLTGLEAEFKE